MNNDLVVLVDDADQPIGYEEKIKAHRQGLLHRAFSVFLFDQRGHLLLQRRTKAKYHSGGLWSNTCCSHPRPGEEPLQAAQRRLKEEMGILCPVTKAFDFVYRARVGKDLIEHEFDHVFTGHYDGAVQPDPDEVMDYKWVSAEAVRDQLKRFPQQYTPWFALAWDRAAAANRDSLSAR